MPEETEPPIREFADRGTLWLLELPENLRGLLKLVAADIADKLNFEKAERLNRSFIPDNLQKQEADLLYQVPFRRGRNSVWVYVLLEHQSKPDRTMGFRLLSYMVQLWQTQVRGWQDAKTPVSRWKLNPIIPIVFYTGKRNWTHPLTLQAVMDTPGQLNAFVPTWDTLFLNLHQTPPDLLAQSASAIAWVLRVFQDADSSQEVLMKVLADAITFLESLPEEAQAEWRRAMQFLFLLVHHKREPEEHAELSEQMVESVERRHRMEVSEMAMTSAQALMAKGREEGKIEEAQVLLLRLGRKQLGEPDDLTLTTLNSIIEKERLEGLLERVLDSETWEELLAEN